jgi:hypothetical protein
MVIGRRRLAANAGRAERTHDFRCSFIELLCQQVAGKGDALFFFFFFFFFKKTRLKCSSHRPGTQTDTYEVVVAIYSPR